MGDSIYYQNQSDKFKIYKIGTDGSNKTKISDEPTGPFSIVNDKIFYANSQGLYTMNLNGKEKVKVIDDKVSCFNVHNGWIYYSNKSDSYKLYKVKIDGTSKTKVADTSVMNINIIDDWIFFNRVKINEDGSSTWSTKHIYAIKQDMDTVFELQAAHSNSTVTSKTVSQSRQSTKSPTLLSTLGYLRSLLFRALFTFFIPLIIIAIIISMFKRAHNYSKLLNFMENLKDNLTDNKVKKLIGLIQKTKFAVSYEMKNKLISAFILVNESENIHSGLKYELRDLLLTKGVPITNVNIKKSKEEEQMAKKYSGKKGEEDVQYALDWLEDYKTLHNVKIPHHIAAQEFDHIVIGKNGVFHIETKNHSGIIRIKENGDWLQIKNGNTMSVENPLFQVQRHEKVLKDYFSNVFPDRKIPIKSIVVIANPKTILEGEENSPVTVLKRERLNSFIEDYKIDGLLDDKTILEIYRELSSFAEKR